MKRLFEELRENLEEFVAQDDYPALVVACLPEELAYVASFLRALDEKRPADFILIFGETFGSPQGYVDGAVAALRAQLDAAAPVRQERGEPPFPPPPALLEDRRQSPASRLAGLLDYARGLLPNEADHRVVVGFLPLACSDPDGYAELMASILPGRELTSAWRAVRMVAYDDRSGRPLAPRITAQGNDRVLLFEVDFSTPKLTDALNVSAADTSLPLAERMASLLQLAALDYSYKRYDDALAKYAALYAYYDAQKIPAMGALCLLGAGDTLRASGQIGPGKEMLQRGIAFALEHRALPPLLNGLMSIVELCFEQREFEEAEGYADSAARVAAGSLNAIAYCDLLERRGDAQLARGKLGEALQSLQKCRELSGKYGYHAREISALTKLVPLYEQLGRPEHSAAERELAALQRASPGRPTSVVSPEAGQPPAQTPS
jgi:tetratricopeptide (TPR) repeat protein